MTQQSYKVNYYPVIKLILQPQATKRSDCFQVWTEAVISSSRTTCLEEQTLHDPGTSLGALGRHLLYMITAHQSLCFLRQKVFFEWKRQVESEIFLTQFPKDWQLRSFLNYGKATISHTATARQSCSYSLRLGTFLAGRWRYFAPLTRIPGEIFIHDLLTEKITAY